MQSAEGNKDPLSDMHAHHAAKLLSQVRYYSFLACDMLSHPEGRCCRSDRDREDLHHSLEQLMPFVNLPFFSLAGAALQVDALAEALWLGSVIYVVRLCAVYCGSWAGCWLSSTPPEHRKRMWQAMITQVRAVKGGRMCDVAPLHTSSRLLHATHSSCNQSAYVSPTSQLVCC